MALTLEEAMALAVLRGDRAAAYALADKLVEEHLGNEKEVLARSLLAEPRPGFAFSEAVYGWPEFRDFCRRLGVPYEAPTTSLAIRLEIGSVVVVEHGYNGSDTRPRGAGEGS